MKTVAGAAPEAAAALPAKKSPMVLIIAIVAILAIAGGVVATLMITKKHAPPPKPDPGEYVKVGETVPLDEFMINLADPSNDHYLKTTMTLGLKPGVAAEKFKDKLPEVRDVIIMVLTSKRLAEIKSPAGKTELKNTLRERINTALGEKDIADIYFQDFAMQ